MLIKKKCLIDKPHIQCDEFNIELKVLLQTSPFAVYYIRFSCWMQQQECALTTRHHPLSHLFITRNNPSNVKITTQANRRSMYSLRGRTTKRHPRNHLFILDFFCIPFVVKAYTRACITMMHMAEHLLCTGVLLLYIYLSTKKNCLLCVCQMGQYYTKQQGN